MFKLIPFQSGKKHLIRFTVNSAMKASVANSHVAASSEHHVEAKFDRMAVHPRIGHREIVGYGTNGQPTYVDLGDTPMPAIRWAEDTAEIKQLREKAKGDWSKLTIDEKKTLYRADFRSTYAEMTAPNGEWKFNVGGILGFMGASILIYYFLRKYIYDYPRPATNSEEHQVRMAERMIGEGQGKIHGISAGWDYEKGDWKSKK